MSQLAVTAAQVIEDLDLVEVDDKITHEVDLMDTSIKGEEMLNIFKPQDPDVRSSWLARSLIPSQLVCSIEWGHSAFVVSCSPWLCLGFQEYEADEKKWNALSKEILGEASSGAQQTSVLFLPCGSSRAEYRRFLSLAFKRLLYLLSLQIRMSPRKTQRRRARLTTRRKSSRR